MLDWGTCCIFELVVPAVNCHSCKNVCPSLASGSSCMFLCESRVFHSPVFSLCSATFQKKGRPRHIIIAIVIIIKMMRRCCRKSYWMWCPSGRCFSKCVTSATAAVEVLVFVAQVFAGSGFMCKYWSVVQWYVGWCSEIAENGALNSTLNCKVLVQFCLWEW